MTDLIFLDTETTGLALSDDIWEFAAIRRRPDGTETRLHLFIEHDERKCRVLPESFREDHYARFPSHNQETPRPRAAHAIGNFLAKREGVRPHIVGAVPNFDTERIALLLADVNRSPEWHYHLIDVENLAVGYLAGVRRALPDLPWSSDDLSRAVGVEPPTDGRHTAMGDAEWAMALYDAIAGVHLPCLQPMTVPPFEPCPNPADPDHPDQLCDEHANRRRT